jgi:hypothetical protein
VNGVVCQSTLSQRARYFAVLVLQKCDFSGVSCGSDNGKGRGAFWLRGRYASLGEVSGGTGSALCHIGWIKQGRGSLKIRFLEQSGVKYIIFCRGNRIYQNVRKVSCAA